MRKTLFFGLIVLVLVIIGGLTSCQMTKINPNKEKVIENEEIKNQPTSQPTIEKEEYQPEISTPSVPTTKNEETIKDLKAEIETLRERIFLLAIINNQNISDNKIAINSDWTIDEMPDNIRYESKSEKEYIKKFIKKKEKR